MIKTIFFVIAFVPVVYAGNPFHMGKVSYFLEPNNAKPKTKTQETLDWREPVLGPDGRVQYILPPGPVLEFLNNPTAANARAYLRWQDRKMARIAKAQQVLAKASQERK